MLVKVRVLEKGTFISNEYNGMGKRKCIKHHNSINSVELFFSFEGPMTSFTRKSNSFRGWGFLQQCPRESATRQATVLVFHSYIHLNFCDMCICISFIYIQICICDTYCQVSRCSSAQELESASRRATAEPTTSR